MQAPEVAPGAHWPSQCSCVGSQWQAFQLGTSNTSQAAWFVSAAQWAGRFSASRASGRQTRPTSCWPREQLQAPCCSTQVTGRALSMSSQPSSGPQSASLLQLARGQPCSSSID
jgi:hypothetical protein